MKIYNRAPKQNRHTGKKILLILLVLITAGILDSRWRIVTTQYDLHFSDLPQGFEGYRIVQLSDFHLTKLGKDNRKLLTAIEEQKPDMIVLTGDFINESKEKTNGAQSEELRPFLEALLKIAPCYYVTGNNEWASTEMKFLPEMLAQIGVTYLKNQSVLLSRGGQQIVLAGVDDPNGPADMIKPDALCQKLSEEYPGMFKILLAHRNDWPAKYPDLPVDLIICGHAHGGVIRLPGIGGLFGPGRTLLPKYDAGLFHSGSYDMVISRGVGNGKELVPRFLNNPEVVTIVLHQN